MAMWKTSGVVTNENCRTGSVIAILTVVVRPRKFLCWTKEQQTLWQRQVILKSKYWAFSQTNISQIYLSIFVLAGYPHATVDGKKRKIRLDFKSVTAPSPKSEGNLLIMASLGKLADLCVTFKAQDNTNWTCGRWQKSCSKLLFKWDVKNCLLWRGESTVFQNDCSSHSQQGLPAWPLPNANHSA